MPAAVVAVHMMVQNMARAEPAAVVEAVKM
jgi:hypothetical protein